MDAVLSIFLFFIGLVFGSFYNVVIYRVPEGKSIITPQSSCGNCKTSLKPLDLIPVFSYIFLKGKCRYCKAPISFQYPLVEFLSGALFVILYLKYGLSVEWFFTVYLMSILLIIFFIDLKHMIIPNEFVLAGLIGGAALFALRFWYSDSILDGAQWYSPLLGMLVPSVFMLLVALAGAAIYGGDALGMGDVKIFLPIGLFLGLKLGIIALILSIFVGGITSFVLIATRVKDRKSQIPFGPFIVAGTFLALLFGQEIYVWYMGTM